MWTQVAWHSGKGVGRINEVPLHRAWLLRDGCRLRHANDLSVSPSHMANSAPYPQLDRK